MKKILLLGICFYSSVAFANNSLAKSYQDFKTDLAKETGLSYSLDASFLGQRGAPSGKGTAWQSQYYGTLAWNAFNSDVFGTGTFNLAYTLVRYWGDKGDILSNRLGVVSGINDYLSDSNSFDELSYTHIFPGSLRNVSLTLGQFPLYNFDGTDFNSNQQVNFLNYALSQNASSVYPTASLGAFVTVKATSEWNFSLGAQNANNVMGDRISWNDFNKGKWTSFVSGMWNPSFKGLEGEYGLMLYHQPSVSEQPESSYGWSVNAQQFINKKVALFARLNGVNKSQNSIKQSYVFGGVMNDPFDRNALDQFGFAVAMNKMNKLVDGSESSSWESVLEGYFALGVSSFMTITPDVQFYINPGDSSKDDTATVVSLRATFMF